MVAFLNIRPVRGFLSFPKPVLAVREVIFNDPPIRQRRPLRLVSHWLSVADGHLVCHWAKQRNDNETLRDTRTKPRQ
jgi:hypothetical protein